MNEPDFDALQKIVDRMRDSFGFGSRRFAVEHFAVELQAEIDKLKAVEPEDIKKLNALSVGTKLYAASQQPVDVQEAIDAALVAFADEYDKMECLPTCDSYGHDEICPWVNTGAYIRSRIGSNPLAEARERIAKLEGKLKQAENMVQSLLKRAPEIIQDLSRKIAELQEES